MPATTTPQPKTQKELQDLMASWTNDPHWDLEDTDGFELYRDQLLAYSNRKKDEWNANHIAKILGRMDRFRDEEGSYDRGLVATIIHLEDEVRRLSNELRDLRQQQS